MQTITLDLTRQQEIADMVADKEPGDTVNLRTSIKSKDDKSLVLTIEEADVEDRPEDKDVETEPEVDEAEEVAGFKGMSY